MSIDRKRWAQKAQELKFHQLDAARRQAEGWRTGLAGLTALLGAVLIVKGRDNVSELTPVFRWVVVILLGMALGMLVWATLLAVRAASGMPGEDVLLSGEDLRTWTAREVQKVSRAIRRATVLATVAVVVVALAVGCAWLGSVEKSGAPLIAVEHDKGRACGELVRANHRQLILRDSRTHQNILVPLAAIVTMSQVPACTKS